jgi:hypothetical protein
MSELAKKAYDAYKRTAKMNFVQVTTAKLNVIYNIECRMKRDEEYKRELDAFVTEEGETIGALIEKYFTGYNARHGLEIRENLTEFTDPDFAEGGYFVISTYKADEDGLVPCDPTEFHVGDRAHAVMRLFSHSENRPLKVSKIWYIVLTDDGERQEGTVENADTVEVDFTLSRPGWVYFRANAIDENGKNLLGMDTAFGGALFDMKSIPLTKKSPDDLHEFWENAIDRLMSVDPTDTVPDGYEGKVLYEYDMPSENRFELIKFDEDYVRMLREYKIGNVTEQMLETFDFYELNLKAPGPCHSANYLTVPKNADPKSLYLQVSFDGYSAYPPSPAYSKNCICLHCSHHGYKLPRPLEGYYMKLRQGVCMHYGLGDGKPNSLYEDLNDNYMIYLHLRNLQAIRFVTDPALSSMIAGLHEIWNGEVKLTGGSMGGYQAICTAALLTILREKSAPFTLLSAYANVPAFCNLAGREDKRVPCMTYYTEGMEYFDAAHLSAFIDVPVTIPRVGLGDKTCSPNGILAMFNNIPSGVHKEISFLQGSDHGYLPEPDFQKWYKYSFD